MESIEGKWMFNRECDGIWNGGTFATREAAIEEGHTEYENDTSGMTEFFVGQVNGDISININTDNILDNISESVYEQVGEVAEDYLGYIKQEDLNALDRELSDVILKWMKEKGYEPHYFKIINTESVKLKEEK